MDSTQKTLRALIIQAIKYESYSDYAYERGDRNAAKFESYEGWLSSLDNDDLLEAYRRVVTCD